jgi:hypothetical protein
MHYFGNLGSDDSICYIEMKISDSFRAGHLLAKNLKNQVIYPLGHSNLISKCDPNFFILGKGDIEQIYVPFFV